VSENCLPLLDVLLHEHKLAYILLDDKQQLLEQGGNSHLFFAPPTPDSDVYELIPELMGCEEILQDITNGQMPRFELPNVNRNLTDGNIHYVSINIVPYQMQCTERNTSLLITLSDTTDWLQQTQELTQQRNEMTLLKHSLDDTNQRLEFIMQRYVPKEVSKALMENRLLPDLGGEVREITALFVDLRNYTGISERLTPTETIEMINNFLAAVCQAIVDAGGMVVNYMGDAVMAIFNALEHQPDHARRAVQAGLQMQSNPLQLKNRDNEQNETLYFGVGINSGQALVGNIGALQHYQYTAIGDIINVASRICGQARPTEVLIGANSFEQIDDRLDAEALPPMVLKGKSQPLTVYRVKALSN